MKRPTLSRIRYLVFITLFFCFVVYVGSASFGYITFCSRALGNVLECFASTNKLVLYSRIALVLVMIFSFPLYSYTLREALEALFFPHLKRTFLRTFLLTLAVVLPIFLLAYTAHDLDVVLGLSGSIGGCTIVFIVPGLYSLQLAKLHKEHVQQAQNLRTSSNDSRALSPTIKLPGTLETPLLSSPRSFHSDTWMDSLQNGFICPHSKLATPSVHGFVPDVEAWTNLASNKYYHGWFRQFMGFFMVVFGISMCIVCPIVILMT